MIILITSLNLLSACAPEPKKFFIDGELLPYYNEFVSYGLQYGRDHSTDNIVIEFGEIPKSKLISPTTVGVCKKELESYSEFAIIQKHYFYPHVIINKKVFDNLDDKSRRALVFHELGHCILNRGHDESITDVGYAKSLMYPSLVTTRLGYFYDQFEPYYIQEMFDPSVVMVDPYRQHNKLADVEFVENEVIKVNVESNADVFVMGIDGCEEIK